MKLHQTPLSIKQNEMLLQRAAEAHRYNAPGQTVLQYRAGTYATFLEEMLARAPGQAVLAEGVDGKQETYFPLAKLNTHRLDDFAIGLLGAWAVVGDVLTFYQERIANEGYLRTATETASVHYLAGALGYTPSPGVAASTYLAFTLLDVPGAPEALTLHADGNTVVQSLPGQNEKPVTFEPSNKIVVRPAWNAIKPYIATVTERSTVGPGTVQLRLQGVVTGLKPGARLLIIDAATIAAGKPLVWYLRTLKSVEPNRTERHTLVIWEEPLGGSAALKAPGVFAFGQQAALFGRKAPTWQSLPDKTKRAYATPKGGVFLSAKKVRSGSRPAQGLLGEEGAQWQSASAGLPGDDVRALALDAQGTLFAGTASGVYCRTAKSTTWEPCSTGLAKRDVHALLLTRSGYLLAGTSGGGVYRSTDGGASWAPVLGSVLLGKRFLTKATTRRVPNTVVRSLLRYTSAGADEAEPLGKQIARDVKDVEAVVKDIERQADLSKDLEDAEAAAQDARRSLILLEEVGGSGAPPVYLFIGTDNGMLRSRENSEAWIAVNEGMPGYNKNTGLAGVVVHALAAAEGHKHLYAGTDKGLYYSRNNGDKWHLVKGWPTTAGVVYALAVFSVGETTYYVAGTEQGLYRATKKDGAWRSVALPVKAAVRALVVATGPGPSPKTFLYAGTSQGVFRSEDQGASWVRYSDQAVLLFSVDMVFQAELDAKCFSTNLQLSFAKHGVALSETATVEIETPASKWRLTDTTACATATYTITVNATGDQLNVYHNTVLTNTNVQALAAQASRLAAAAPFDGFVETEWPGFDIQKGQLFLDKVSSGILAGSWVVLTQSRLAPSAGIYQANAVTTRSRTAFSQTATVTRIDLENDGTLGLFDLRETVVSAQSDALALWQKQTLALKPIPDPALNAPPHQGTTLRLDGAPPTFYDNQKLSITGQRMSVRLQPHRGGVFALADSTTTWASLNLPNQDIRALAADQLGNLYAGTLGHGVYVQPRRDVHQATGTAWMPFNKQAVLCFQTPPGDTDTLDKGALSDGWRAVFAAHPQASLTGAVTTSVLEPGRAWQVTGSHHTYQIEKEDDQISVYQIGVLADPNIQAMVMDGQGRLYMGTAGGGIFRMRKPSPVDAAWLPAEAMWEQVVEHLGVRALVVDAQGRLYAGTQGDGVFRSVNGGDAWEAVNAGLTNLEVQALAADAQGRLYAGTQGGGVFRSVNGGDAWEAVNAGLTNLEVQALAADAQDRLYAGTQGGGVFRSVNGGDAWEAVNAGLTNLEVQALAADAQGRLYAGTQGGGVFRSLDRGRTWEAVPIGIANDVRVLLPCEGGQLLAGTRNVTLLTSLDGQQETELKQPHLFDLDPDFANTLNRGVVSQTLQAAFRKNDITLTSSAVLTVLVENSSWLLRDVEEYVIRAGADALQVYANERLQALAPPSGRAGEARQWWLRTTGGAEGVLTAAAGEVAWAQAARDNETVSEVVTIQDSFVAPHQEYTEVRVAEALHYLYDPQTATLSANVVAATHGETVGQEVLGSGNASVPNQQFSLIQAPLTYVSAPTPSGLKSTLTVRLTGGIDQNTALRPGSAVRPADGMLWKEVSALYQSDPHHRHYIVRHVGDGTATLTFGDGKQGARLPTGRENIMASYRVGLGRVGNVAANRLQGLKKRPAGIGRVTNPVPATGGTDPESDSLIRDLAPRSVGALSRIVSLDDYENFALAFAGIGKASVAVLWDGRQRLVHLTIAATTGAGVEPDSDLYRNLSEAIKAYRAFPQPMQIDSYQPCYFNMAAVVTIDPSADEKIVQAALELVLHDAFRFENRALGQDVAASELTALIQRVEGVVAVEMTKLYRVGFEPALETVLHAAKARFDEHQQQILPAELLLFNTHGGITLHLGRAQ